MGCNPGVIGFLHGRIRHPAQNAAYSFLHTNHEARDLNRSQWQAISTRAFNNCTTNTEKASGLNQTWVWTYTKIYFIMCSRFGEVCSWCISALLPGPAWVLLNYVLRRIIKPLYLRLFPVECMYRYGLKGGPRLYDNEVKILCLPAYSRWTKRNYPTQFYKTWGPSDKEVDFGQIWCTYTSGTKSHLTSLCPRGQNSLYVWLQIQPPLPLWSVRFMVGFDQRASASASR